MDYIQQAQLARLARSVASGRVVVVYGPRRVGKTTLVRRYMRQHDPDALLVSGEDIDVREYLESQSVARLRAFVGRHRTLIDLVEERAGSLEATEMKWSPKPGLRAPRAWRQAYPDSSFRVVERENYLVFITAE